MRCKRLDGEKISVITREIKTVGGKGELRDFSVAVHTVQARQSDKMEQDEETRRGKRGVEWLEFPLGRARRAMRLRGQTEEGENGSCVPAVQMSVSDANFCLSSNRQLIKTEAERRTGCFIL